MYLQQVSLKGSKLGLENLKSLLEELGNPQEELSYVHIAGTNGKGSILAYTSSILTTAGYKTGRYLSPVVLSEREKIQVDGAWITEMEFTILAEQVKQAVSVLEKKGMDSPTVFELETAIAFLHFKAKHCQMVVLETGLGGDLDATNIITNTKVAAFASISKDHMAYLGDTLTEIAEKKAGIMKKGCIVITQRQKSEVQRVLESGAEKKNVPLITTDRAEITVLEETWRAQKVCWRRQQGDPITFCIPLAGDYQIENTLVACQIIESLRTLGFLVTEDDICKGIQSVTWPGRFQCIKEDPIVIVDGAHNVDAVEQLKRLVLHFFKGRTIRLIAGVFKDKPYETFMSIMAPLAKKIYTINLPQSDRTLGARELQQCARRYCLDVECCDTAKEALANAVNESKKEDIILAFGSLSYIGELLKDKK